MKILALEYELPGIAREQFQVYGKEEARRVWELNQRGTIRELYFRADRHSAVLVLECSTTAEAAAFLADLPFVRESLIGFDLIPLVAYPGFSRLFGVDDKAEGEK